MSTVYRPMLSDYTPSNLIISGPVTGPIISNGGAITVTGSGSIAGNPDGIDAINYAITTLNNQLGGIISGGIGSSSPGSPGGVGVSNANTITTLTNGGTINGGNGGFPGGAGGTGVSDSGTITTLINTGMILGGGGGDYSTVGGAGIANTGMIAVLTNKGTISGGFGGSTGSHGFPGPNGLGVANSGTIKTLTNSGIISNGVLNKAESKIGLLTNQVNGAISGGDNGGYASSGSGGGVKNNGSITTLTNNGSIKGGIGAVGSGFGVFGGAGIANAGTIGSLGNSGRISGGIGAGGPPAVTNGVTGGAGISNSGTITILTNSGVVTGGSGGSGRDSSGFGGAGGAGGAGIENSGTIAALTNSGTIHGGVGGPGVTASGAPGDAIDSTGSIGSLTNSGKIIGYVEIDNQAIVTVHGGTGKTFGTWIGGAINGGAITVGQGNLDFASGNTEIDENISVDGGNGTVSNDGVLRFAALEVINGDFTNDGTARVSAGKLEIEGAVTGAGTDTISGPAKLQFDAGVSTAATLGDQDIDLSGKGGTMALVDPTGFYGKISDFGSNDTVKLEGFWAFSAVSHASGVTTLTLAEGATRHAFEFVGDYTRREFHISAGSITKVTYV